MSDNKNIDPVEELLNRTRATMNGESVIEKEDDRPTEPEVSVVNNILPDEDEDEDIYGVNDLANEIAAEEEADRIAQLARAKEAKDKREAKENSKVFMPPDEHDMAYHTEALQYQNDKISTVSAMVNRVVAKYRLISGGIPTQADPEKGILDRMQVMGELVDIYHNAGETITPEFEQMVLKNWVMPDGTLAIHNLNEDGIVIDRTMLNQPTNTSNNTNTTAEAPVQTQISNEPATINIEVPNDTPVTVNVDENVVNEMTTSKKVNIYVKEVSEKELLKSVIVENSQAPGIIKPYDSGINDVPITLPLSAYRCTMRSINWMDFIKLTAPTSNNSSDNELKKWSVLYDHVKNPSIGAFKDFEDFLRKTKYQDRELLMWALLVATSDEEEPITITCGNPKCKNQIHLKYRPRNIIHVDEKLVPEWWTAAGEAEIGPQAVQIWEMANARRKRYRLPNTGIIAEINEPSAYTFINEKLPLINALYKRYRPDEDDMSKLDANDISMAEFDYLSANALFITALTIVRNENGKDKEYRFTDWDSIEEIITKALDATDSGVLLKIIEKSREHVSPISFRIENVNCPTCGRHEEFIPITEIGNTLLFQVSQRLSNTQISLIEMD